MSETIQTLLQEDRSFTPSPDFVRQANANDASIYETAAADPIGFWEEWAKKLDWFEPWHTACEFKPPDAFGFDSRTMHLEIVFRAAESSQFPQALPRFGDRLTQMEDFVDKHRAQNAPVEGYGISPALAMPRDFYRVSRKKCQLCASVR